MNTIVKEMWLDDNLMENVDFVNDVYGLEVFSASKFWFIYRKQ